MSPKKARTFKTVRGIDLKIRYTQDNGVDTLINQRQFYDQNGVMLGPVTPKLLNRQVITSNPAARLGGIEPRMIRACFGSVVNISGESNFQMIVPYAPGDIDHNLHLREIIEYVSSSSNLEPPTALSVSYHGENKI